MCINAFEYPLENFYVKLSCLKNACWIFLSKTFRNHKLQQSPSLTTLNKGIISLTYDHNSQAQHPSLPLALNTHTHTHTRTATTSGYFWCHLDLVWHMIGILEFAVGTFCRQKRTNTDFVSVILFYKSTMINHLTLFYSSLS